MELTRDEILNVLGNIIEPDLKKDIVSLNLIEDLTFSEKVKLLLTILLFIVLGAGIGGGGITSSIESY